MSIAENLLSDYSGIECDLLRKHLCLFYSDKAVLHLFRVVSGIESMVIGEDEILGQVRLAPQRHGIPSTDILFPSADFSEIQSTRAKQ